ncbi:dienelactone hydrolase family protein [Myxococcota bacterium]|nr:dienelactone hydrolase family protein [Myxococcota bacterium]
MSSVSRSSASGASGSSSAIRGAISPSAAKTARRSSSEVMACRAPGDGGRWRRESAPRDRPPRVLRGEPAERARKVDDRAEGIVRGLALRARHRSGSRAGRRDPAPHRLRQLASNSPQRDRRRAARRTDRTGASGDVGTPDATPSVMVVSPNLAHPEARRVRIPPHGLEGLLSVPDGASGIVVFAHGSGSSRLSPRNRRVADALGAEGLGTLLFDLLTETEADDRERVFDIPLLAERLLEATRWLRLDADTSERRVGYFGASTGAAAALVAATRSEHEIGAVVSRGGRPDLAGPLLAQVRAPTLLIVGSHDPVVLDLNRDALAALRCEKQLAIVPGATHLFEEAGTLDQVIELAGRWFCRHLGAEDDA